MMLAVNATIDGKQKAVDQFVQEHKLSRKELQTRLEMRSGQKYDLSKGRGPRKRRKKKIVKGATASKSDIFSQIDGRTKTVTLVRFEARICELLAQKKKAEVAKVRNAMKNLDKLRNQLAEAEALLG